MNKARTIWSLSLAVALVVLAVAGNTRAATTGKITGTVKDASGEALPGANVIIEGTNRGATTDTDGVYIILAVEPGAYTLSASLIGYGQAKKQNVQIVVDYTTTVDFTLQEATLEMAEVVVVAERPPVEPDKTMSKHVMTSADIESVPLVRTTTELIALQPGMATDGSNRIRGSTGEGGVGYYVDGIEVNRSMFDKVNVTGIQEATVLTGGMNAEFGNARAGVVALVTREGENAYHGQVDYKFTPPGKSHWGTNLYDSPAHKDHIRWNDPDWANETDPQTGDLAHGRTDYTGHTGHLVEANLSGPIGSNLSFFASTRYLRGVSVLPAPAPTSPFNTRNLLTLTFRPKASLKVKIGGLYERHKGYFVTSSNYAGAAKGMGADGRNIFLPENWAASGRQIFTDNMAYLTFTHSLNPRTYYELKLYHVGSKIDTADVPAVTESVRTDADGWFYLPRKIHAYRTASDRRQGAKFDFTTQINRANLLQFGAEIRRYDYYDTRVTFAPEAKDRNLAFVGKDMQLGKGVNPWEISLYAQDKLEYHGMVVNAGIRWDYLNFARNARQAPGMELFPMFNTFTRRQWELDHLEDNVPTMTALSPRVGISHPINDRLSAHYFIGRFHNFPNKWELFSVAYATQNPDQDKNGNGVIDPAEQWNTMEATSARQMSEGMQPERATSIEMGVDWNFYKDYVTSITTHYRYDEGLYLTGGNWLFDPFLGATHYVSSLRNAVASKARGIEVALRKDFSHNFSFRIAYDVQWVSLTDHYGDRESWRFYPDSSYVASGRYWVNWKVESDGSETPVPLTDEEIRTLGAKANRTLEGWIAQAGEPFGTGYYTAPTKINDAGIWLTTSGYGYNLDPAVFDRRNQLSVQFFYTTPGEYGPRLGPVYPFGGLKVSSVYRLVDGLPFEYFPPQGQGEWKKAPPTMRTDLHMEKEFQMIGQVRPGLFLEVTNLFNEKNSTVRYSDFTYVQYGLKEFAPDDETYLTYGDTRDWDRYEYDPRKVELGLRFRF